MLFCCRFNDREQSRTRPGTPVQQRGGDVGEASSYLMPAGRPVPITRVLCSGAPPNATRAVGRFTHPPGWHLRRFLQPAGKGACFSVTFPDDWATTAHGSSLPIGQPVAGINASQQGPYQLRSWKIPREPPACREVFGLAGFQRVRRPSRSPRGPYALGAASAPLGEGKCGRCCLAKRPAPYRQLDCLALPQMKSSRWHTERPEGCA
jgi:hypothetical protein